MKDENSREENAKEEKKQVVSREEKSLSFTTKTLACLLCTISLGFAVLFKILWAFGVDVYGAIHGIFFIISIGLAVVATVMAFFNSKNKFDMTIGFGLFAILISFLAY